MQETQKSAVDSPVSQPSVTNTTPEPAAGLSSVTGAFRRPVVPRRGPKLRTLAALAGWAAAIGVIGLVVGVRGLIAILVGKIPSWYEPTLITMGLVGIALAAAAFLTVQHRHLPWILLGTSSGVLIASIVITAQL
jgi:hypothetical protein